LPVRISLTKAVLNANNKIASELDKTLKGSGTEADTPPITDGRAIVEARDEAAKSRDPNVAKNHQHQDGAGNRTETVPVNDDLTGGKLVNPAQEENKGMTLVTPDRSGEQGPSNTGNTDGLPDTGGNTTVTPIPTQNKDDLAYLAEGDKPANLSPEGAGRSGAFNEAKRQSGIPVSKHPDRVTPNYDRRGKLQPGKNYEFDTRDENGNIKTIIIRDDSKGHFFGDNDPQNRGPHFNDDLGNHYDY